MEFFDQAYEGVPLWEIGRPQPEVRRLQVAGEIRGRVLDLGCGTGTVSLYLAREGHSVVGVDFAPRAIERARSRPLPAGAEVRFEVQSALSLPDLGGPFDTVLDCGLFHTFLDPHRPVYAGNVRAQLAPGGRFFLLCFSEREPTDWGGPRRVTAAELRATFEGPLHERWIREARFETLRPEVTGHAWLAAFERPGESRPTRGGAQ